MWALARLVPFRGSLLDEGITEYFARVALNTFGITRIRSNYQGPWELATWLVAKLGQPIVADAYFGGKYQPLVSAYESTFSTKWNVFATAVEDKKFKPAMALP